MLDKLKVARLIDLCVALIQNQAQGSMMSGRGYDGDLWHEAVDPGCPHINRCGVRAKDILAASFTAVGVVLNVVCGVSRITMEDIIKGVWPFMIAQLIVLFLLVLFPVLVTGPAKCFGG